MPSIPIYFEAKQISTMNVVPCTYDSTGLITEVTGSTAALKALGVFDFLRVNFSPNNFELSASDAPMENYQAGKGTFNGNISALDKNGKVNPLMDFYAGYELVKIVAQGTQHGTGGAAQKILTLYAKIGGTETTYLEGKNATGLILQPCGILAAWAAP